MCERPLFTIAAKHMFITVLTLVALLTCMGLPLSSAVAQTQAILLQKAMKPAPAPPLAEASGGLGSQNIDSVVAVMGDEQVRRLLIDELKARAAEEQLALTGNDDIGGLPGFSTG